MSYWRHFDKKRLECYFQRGFGTCNKKGAPLERGALRRDAVSTTVSTRRTHLTINRTKSFDPSDFIDHTGWTIWRGPADGSGREGEEQQCKEGLALSSIDLAKVRLVTCLKGKEIAVDGEEFIRRLKDGGRPRLDAQVLETLLKNQNFIPNTWKRRKKVCFTGTELRTSGGYRYILFLYWDGTQWGSDYEWLNHNFDADTPAAVGG